MVSITSPLLLSYADGSGAPFKLDLVKETLLEHLEVLDVGNARRKRKDNWDTATAAGKDPTGKPDPPGAGPHPAAACSVMGQKEKTLANCLKFDKLSRRTYTSQMYHARLQGKC